MVQYYKVLYEETHWHMISRNNNRPRTLYQDSPQWYISHIFEDKCLSECILVDTWCIFDAYSPMMMMLHTYTQCIYYMMMSKNIMIKSKIRFVKILYSHRRCVKRSPILNNANTSWRSGTKLREDSSLKGSHLKAQIY